MSWGDDPPTVYENDDGYGFMVHSGNGELTLEWYGPKDTDTLTVEGLDAAELAERFRWACEAAQDSLEQLSEPVIEEGATVTHNRSGDYWLVLGIDYDEAWLRSPDTGEYESAPLNEMTPVATPACRFECVSVIEVTTEATCAARDATEQWACTLAPGHPGAHVACNRNFGQHQLSTWIDAGHLNELAEGPPEGGASVVLAAGTREPLPEPVGAGPDVPAHASLSEGGYIYRGDLDVAAWAGWLSEMHHECRRVETLLGLDVWAKIAPDPALSGDVFAVGLDRGYKFRVAPAGGETT